MTQDLIIAVLLLGLTGLVWTITLATFAQDRSDRKASGTTTSLPDTSAATSPQGATKPSQVEV